METLPFEPLELVAIDPARNIRRRWQVIATYDLFGRVMVETRWGRIGRCGQQRVHSFAGEGEALRYVRALLARRATAPRRLGVKYALLKKGGQASCARPPYQRGLYSSN